MTAAAEPSKAVLLLSCPDRVGLVARIANFIYERGGNILDLNEHVDVDERQFFLRVSWSLDNFSIPADDLESAFAPLAREFRADWTIRFPGARSRRMAVFVSKYDHCLREIFWRHSLGEFDIDIPLIISNHSDLAPLAEEQGVPFHVIAVTPESKAEAESRQMALCDELDEGPIIEQDIIRITHRDTLDDLVRKGRDLERLVLARALRLHCEHRILINGSKTVVFD